MEDIITQAAKFLKDGGVVSLPTETVYSLSVNALDDSAVQKIYQLKGRRRDNPLALFVGNLGQAAQIVKFNKYAEILAEAFLPGPLTIILPRKQNTPIAPSVNEGLNTLAVRMPQNETTLAILNKVNIPIVGTSANPSGLQAAINAMQVKDYFLNSLDMIVDDGNAMIGVASTILDLNSDIPRILRQGSILREQLEEKLKLRIF